ncbi:MAG: redoxin domain-containing protein [Verrucomicrobiota bacterium]
MSGRCARAIWAIAAFFFVIGGVSIGEETEWKFECVDGESHELFAEGEAAKVTVLIFTATDCPVANYFQPTIRRLHEAFAEKGVVFFQVYPDRDTDQESAKDHAKDYEITTTQVLDPSQSLAKRAGATKTPEAVVFNADGKAVYRGRIDDTYADLGKKRPKPKSHDLNDAIKVALSGKSSELVETEAVGCFIYFED